VEEYSQLLNVQGIRNVRQVEIRTAEPLATNLFDFEIAIASRTDSSRV
jgi:hypothetical protein